MRFLFPCFVRLDTTPPVVYKLQEFLKGEFFFFWKILARITAAFLPKLFCLCFLVSNKFWRNLWKNRGTVHKTVRLFSKLTEQQKCKIIVVTLSQNEQCVFNMGLQLKGEICVQNCACCTRDFTVSEIPDSAICSFVHVHFRYLVLGQLRVSHCSPALYVLPSAIFLHHKSVKPTRLFRRQRILHVISPNRHFDNFQWRSP